MKLQNPCPCDLDGFCPYEAESFGSCAYWCGEEEEYSYEEEYYNDL